ncbi:dehydrogenase [Cylindrospermopsis raciborskii S07]|uniref:bi-domain-containing oxidoreductase n=1 Tax=Cylindrospermopsis raciborskii TaxID=77022 RepID=UPI000C9E8D2B|nr:bi-domain-containing oxidoreductase [Cylindrospermopsis raciborskii]PNK02167.1 dehydrogenase [Cylindrospermopsis raciborskii S14]PNK02983.1 dehydrogenase [Cylindrospermopsis raciborskii S10]PNK09236.1 dehydrogenase [Cylindrospermopsis raciborskii S07]PNK13014.1 dehydrogenase [Cylindrospermopsis raciborskii S06]PNK18211.1 dehydrogenase [Cylindrospermopsis raciborskii S05]
MKQILQSLSTGVTKVTDVPAPKIQPGKLLIRSSRSLVSAGTERMLVEFGQSNWLEKARQQPDKVRQVLEKIHTDGIFTTLDAVQTKLDQPLPLGYCNVGTVIGIGDKVTGFQIGDRIVSNGHHAEIVNVPANLCAIIPDPVSDDAAAFTVLAAIGLQAIRLAQPTLGECFVVTGLGLIGILTAQLLQAQGCRVLGLDFAPDKLALANKLGIHTVNLGAGEDPLIAASQFSRQVGVDGVIITASTSSNEPIHQAAQMCRKRGRIILVGVTGLELSRADFYEKELSFQVSCSYGPGRYDPNYEQKGQDYPIGYVRWTEQRNFQAVLDILATGKINTHDLISHRFSIEEAHQAYSVLTSGPCLGILIDYPTTSQPHQTTIRFTDNLTIHPSSVVIGCIGAGNYASRVLIPAFAKTPALLHTLAASSGVNTSHYGAKFGFKQITTDIDSLLDHPEINTIVIATRHDSHADLVCRFLAKGKHIFVEKPLALSHQELEEIEKIYTSNIQTGQPKQLMVGFNRRFAPMVQTMHQMLTTLSQPKVLIITVNAGEIPSNHWTQDPQLGGGRIIGEACHFVDLMRFLVGSSIVKWQTSMLPDSKTCPDSSTITLNFADGSIGTIHYLANGSKAFAKERVEVFCGGKILQLDNYRQLRGWGWSRFRQQSSWRQNKGQTACVAEFVQSLLQGSPIPIGFEELLEVSKATIDIASALNY